MGVESSLKQSASTLRHALVLRIRKMCSGGSQICVGDLRVDRIDVAGPPLPELELQRPRSQISIALEGVNNLLVFPDANFWVGFVPVLGLLFLCLPLFLRCCHICHAKDQIEVNKVTQCQTNGYTFGTAHGEAEKGKLYTPIIETRSISGRRSVRPIASL